MSIDTIGDFLTVIRNGIASSKSFVTTSHSRIKHQIANILKDEGFIRNVHVEEVENSVHKVLKIDLKYISGESVIHEIKRISKPGRRVYEGKRALSPVIGGLGIAILTTSRGIMTNKAAKHFAVGGEVLCTVW